jgi:hypothetical protein
MSKLWQSLALSLVLPLSTGCVTTVAIRSMEPGAVPIGATKHLVLLGGEGRRSAREFVGESLVQQCRARGYFSVEDRSEAGLSVRVAGRQASIEGGKFALEPEQAGLRIDVLEWNAARDEQDVTRTDPTGRQFVERVPVTRGNALLAITLFDPAGRACLAETEYEGSATTDPSAPREDAIEAAARQAIASFLNDITPFPIVTRVRLDDEDPHQEPMLKAASDGATAQAAHELECYVQENPNIPSAAYNLAVLKEAMGDFRAALELYDRAIGLGGKDYYSRARAGCARRLSATESLSTQTSP